MGPGESRERILVAHFAIFLVLLCWCILFFFPGGMSWDSMRQLEEARAGVFSDAHPPTMAVLWRYLDMLTPGPFGMLLLHCLWLLGGLTAIFYLTGQRRPWSNIVLIAVVALWPATFFMIGIVWKDVAMASAYLLSIALFLSYEKTEERALRALLLGLCLVALFYGMSTRHNAAAAVMPLLAFYSYRLLPGPSPHRRAWLAALLGVTCGVLSFGLVQLVNNRLVNTKTNLWQVSVIYDIAGISHLERVNLFPAQLYPEVDLQMVDQFYTPRSVAILWRFSKGIKPLTDDGDLKTLKRTWVRLVLAHPRAYLEHRWAVFKELIGYTLKAPSGAVLQEHLICYRLELKCSQSPMASNAVDSFFRFSETSLLYRPFAYVIVSVVLLVALMRFGIDNRALAIALLSSGLLHMLGLFFVTGAPDYRYSHWMILCTVLALAIVVRDKAAWLWLFWPLRAASRRWRQPQTTG